MSRQLRNILRRAVAPQTYGATLFTFSSMCLLVLEFVKLHPGIVLVLVGVTGEIVLEWRSTKGRLAWLKKTFWALLVLGLALEFGEATKSDKDVADTKNRTALVESTNLVLRAKVVELEAKLKPRRITMEQVRKFIFLTEMVEKVPIKILITTEGRDTEIFGRDLREMFTYAGFKTNSNAGAFGIDRDQSFINATAFGSTNEMSDVMLVHYRTNENSNVSGITTGIVSGIVGRQNTNGTVRPIVSETNQTSVFIALQGCLEQIGVTASWTGNTIMVKPGECLIWVPVK